jgi:response regulator RpfG family c-di-GMP phosphodiesterase
MNKNGILVIGGDEKFRRRLASLLTGLGLDVEKSDALPGPGGITASQIILPAIELGNGGGALLRKIRVSDPGLFIIVLAGTSDSRRLIPFLEEGLIDQVAGPDHIAAIYAAVLGGLAKNRLAAEIDDTAKRLARLKQEHAKSVRKALELEEIYDATVDNLMTALDLRDVETFGHSRTVAKYSHVLAQMLGIHDASILDNIRKGSLLHDVGKIAIPDAILKKPGPLSAGEWEKIKFHPALGYGLVKEIKLVKEAGNIILCHHEKYDGSGYPEGLSKDHIPLEARIFALADALDAITSHRPYRRERDFAAAKKEIRSNAGTHFDPRVVEAFDGLPLGRWERIRFETTRMIPAVIDDRGFAARK